MKFRLILLALLFSLQGFTQSAYLDSLSAFRKNYISNHEVVKAGDREHLHFFSADEKYLIPAQFERIENSPWFKMETSGTIKKMYRVFGKAHFKVQDTVVTLSVYQSQDLMQMEKYRDHLFIPFTDATSGVESYEGGRYIDLGFSDIKNDILVIDFNKAYNPYCAYVSNIYNCPIPPRENRLTVAIPAGEKAYTKPH